MSKNIILKNVYLAAGDFAKTKQHEYFTKFHILIILLMQEQIRKLLEKSKMDLGKMNKHIKQKLSELEVYNGSTSLNYYPKQSDDIDHISAISHEHMAYYKNVGIELFDILLAIIEFKDSDEYFFLVDSGMDLEIVKDEIINNKKAYTVFDTSKTGETHKVNSSKKPQSNHQQHQQSQAPDQRVPASSLEELRWITNLTKEINKINNDPMIGREEEVEKLVYALAKRKKNNAILVGEPGVGKTAIVEGLTKLINAKKVPSEIQKMVVYSLDLTAMMASTKFRGEMEERLNETISLLKKTPNSILFIDEIHTIVNAGSVSGGGMDVANILKPVMASGEVRFIGATTYSEYRNFFEKDAALSRRFQKIDIEEPTEENSVKILLGLKSQYEAFHKVKYLDDSVSLAVKLSIKHVQNRFLPDKAIDILDEAGTLVKFNPEEYKGIVSAKAVKKVISKMTRIPEETMNETVKNQVENLEERLKSVIFGQNEAITKIVETVQMSKAGLNNQNKPIGSFMFAGPTGVGKTELTNQLSKFLSMNMVRIDMSEFKEAHTVSRLIGAPPGYVGSNQEGQLTGAVVKNPNSIILLDEMEKAHPDVLDLLLQILDHGTLTDSQGKKANFRQAVIICTTNSGSSEVNRPVIGLNLDSIKEQRDPLGVIKNSFRPEFLNRFDSIIWFNSLTKENVKNVLYKHVKDLTDKLSQTNSSIEFTTEAEDYLINKGYSTEYGARPMERVFQDEIKKPLSKEILFGKLQNPAKIMVSIKDNKLFFDIKAIKVRLKKTDSKQKVSAKTNKEVVVNE